MRNLPSAAPATSAAPPAPTTPNVRKLIILAKIDKLRATEPPGWKGWDYITNQDFAADVERLRRLARPTAPLSHVLRISERVARAYGVDMAAIDPCHGEAA